MQNVPLARRFALVPLGPPSLRYSSISKAMIKHDEEANEVTLLADRAYKKGAPCPAPTTAPPGTPAAPHTRECALRSRARECLQPLRGPRAGDRVIAWCGPQPNLKLLLNYGIVDENNPYDKLTVTATVPTAGPLFQIKRRLLETASATPRPAPWCPVRACAPLLAC